MFYVNFSPIFPLQQLILCNFKLRKTNMKHFNLAVASIVDAYTGNGLNRQFIDQYGSNYSAHKKHSHEIRSRSLMDLAVKIKSAVKIHIDDSKTEARKRQATKQLIQLNDRLLKDIGLTREDLYEIGQGSTSLGALNARRNFKAGTVEQSQVTGQVSSRVRSIESANQAQYETKKCA